MPNNENVIQKFILKLKIINKNVCLYYNLNFYLYISVNKTLYF